MNDTKLKIIIYKNYTFKYKFSQILIITINNTKKLMKRFNNIELNM